MNDLNREPTPQEKQRDKDQIALYKREEKLSKQYDKAERSCGTIVFLIFIFVVILWSGKKGLEVYWGIFQTLFDFMILVVRGIINLISKLIS